MMAELTPPGFENMVCTFQHNAKPQTHVAPIIITQFFGLFGLSNRASSMIGPNVIQAIIDKTGNNWQGFPFLFALCVAASIVIWFAVDVTKGRRDAVSWAEETRAKAGAAGGIPSSLVI